jgi:hypothetical protein
MQKQSERFHDVFIPETEADEELLTLIVTGTLHKFGGIGYQVLDVDDAGRVTVAVTLVGDRREPELMAVYVVDEHFQQTREIHRLRVVMADDGEHQNLIDIIEMTIENDTLSDWDEI